MAGEGFLGRWSRLKQNAEVAGDPEGQAAPDLSPPNSPAQVAAIAPRDGLPDRLAEPSAFGAERSDPAAPPAAERLELPSIDSLGKDSDFSVFMRADVDPGLRVSALKKLFTDPHFNQMDGLDIYIDDYSKPDPMPLAMLKRLNQSRLLGLMEDDAETKMGTSAEAVPAPDDAPLEVSQTEPAGGVASSPDGTLSTAEGPPDEIPAAGAAQAPAETLTSASDPSTSIDPSGARQET